MANKNVVIKKRNSGNTDWDTMYPVTTAENVKCSDGKSVDTCLAETTEKQGDLITLQTTEKNSLVGAINEVFQDADNGKTNIYNAIVGKGTTPTSQNFSDLVSAVNNISTGKKFATGAISLGAFNNPYTFVVDNLEFKPSKVIINGRGNTGALPGNITETIIISSEIDLYYYGVEKTKAIRASKIDSSSGQGMEFSDKASITSNGFTTRLTSLSYYMSFYHGTWFAFE